MTDDFKVLEDEFLVLMAEANRDSEEASRKEKFKAKRMAELLRSQAQRICEYKGALPRENKQTTA